MKKAFQFIGIVTLICFSFFYTEKTATVVKEFDDVMIQIRNVEPYYYQEAVDATIVQNKITPGINGIKINANKSYNRMKRYGKYDESLLVFETIAPDISVSQYYDKYIVSGNTSKKEVSLIFLIRNSKYIDSILEIMDDKDIKGSFFLDGSIIDNKKELIKDLIYKEHDIGNLGFNGTYNDENYTWTNVYIKKTQGFSYCYTEIEDEATLNICSANKNQTIIPSIKITNSFDKKIKSKISNGSIIAIEVNNVTLKELPVLINYIISKGYSIQNLHSLIKE